MLDPPLALVNQTRRKFFSQSNHLSIVSNQALSHSLRSHDRYLPSLEGD